MHPTVLVTLASVLAVGSAAAQTAINAAADVLNVKQDPLGLLPNGYYPPVPASAEEHAAWLAERAAFKPTENILRRIDFTPAFSTDADAPNWYAYHGVNIPLRLWGQRIAVQFDGGIEVARQFAILASVGIKPVQVEQGGTQGWAVYHLEQPIADCSAAKDVINALINIPGVQAAAPVFHSPLDAKLWLFPAKELAVQARAAGAAGAAAVQRLRPDLLVNDADWAGCAGMMRVLSPHRNGFETIKASSQLAAQPNIAWSEPLFVQQIHLPFIPNDSQFGNQWWLRNTLTPGMDMGAARAWNVANGSGIRVVVVDNGFQRNHPDVTFASGRDFTDGTTGGFGDGSPGSSCDRHGTPCGGIIAASANNSTGVAGAAFGGQTYVGRVAYNNVNMDGSCAVNAAANAESATMSVTWIVNGLNWGLANGCRISSQSIGFGGPSSTYETAITNLHSGGMAHFVSSGNDGSASVSYPASYAGVNSIGSVDYTGTKTDFSQYGNGLDFTAPGTSIYTTDRSGAAGYNMSTTDGDYTYFGGTSSAAPVAAGTAALALSSKPWLSAGAMETDLYHSTIDRGAAGYDTTYGWGIINAYKFMVYPFETQANDACGNATNLGNANITFSQNVTSAIDDAVAEAQESCEAGGVGVFHSVWYRWTAPTFGTINVDTIGSNYDTVLSVWDGCGVYNSASDTFSPPTQMACNDDISSSNLASSVSNVRLKTGQTVRIKVSRYGRSPATSFNSLTSTLHLTFTPGPPTNNACNTAEPMTFADAGGSLFYESPLWDTTRAANLTGCAQETAASCVFASTKPVWWTFTAPGDGVMLFQTYESNYDTVLSIYSGCGRLVQIGVGGQTICLAPTQEACSDDLEPGTVWSNIPNFNVLAGQTYKVRLAGYGQASPGGLARLRAWFSPVNYPAPANDACSNATIIPPESTSFTDSGSNMGATVDNDCGDPPANTIGTVTSRSVWWTFTPPIDGICSVNTIDSSFDTTMSIYDATATGCAARDANNVCVYPAYVTYDEDGGAGYTSVISGQALVAGHVYLIRVAGYGTVSRGTVSFNFSFEPAAPVAPANDAWVAALPMPNEVGSAFTSAPIDTRAATSDNDCGDGLVSCTGDVVGNSIWFTITPATNGLLAANTLQSDYDTVLAIFDATDGGPSRDELGNCVNPPEVICSDNVDEATLQSSLGATLVAGRTYLIAVFAKDGGGQAILDATFTGASCPADLAGLGGNPEPDGMLTVDDLVSFLSSFFAADSRADLAGLGGAPGADGILTVDDLVFFLSVFFNGCP